MASNLSPLLNGEARKSAKRKLARPVGPLVVLNSVATGGAFAAVDPTAWDGAQPPPGEPARPSRTGDQHGDAGLSAGQQVSLTKRQTVLLLEVLCACNPAFKFDESRIPRRVLTKPSQGVSNDGFDNANADYILRVNDTIADEHGHRYIVIDMLGKGTFGQVVRCRQTDTHEEYAVKIVKNKPAYFNQSMMEVQVLSMLERQLKGRPEETRFVRMHHHFVFRNHLVMVFELLSVNFYELIKQNRFRGLSMTLLRMFLRQILEGLSVLKDARIIHCDLKPENLLLKDAASPEAKIIDFGSACFERETIYSYIQSRFYRSPEVLLRMPYTQAVDVWSLGCIAAELYLGLPIFPGTSEYDQIARIVGVLGVPPAKVLARGTASSKYFNLTVTPDGQATYTLKSLAQYTAETGRREKPSKEYFSIHSLDDLMTQGYRKEPAPERREATLAERRCFIHFLTGVLRFDPKRRWTPRQALRHPFFTGEPFDGRWTPAVADAGPAPISASASSDLLDIGEGRRRSRTLPSAALPLSAMGVSAGAASKATSSGGEGQPDPSGLHLAAGGQMGLSASREGRSPAANALAIAYGERVSHSYQRGPVPPSSPPRRHVGSGASSPASSATTSPLVPRSPGTSPGPPKPPPPRLHPPMDGKARSYSLRGGIPSLSTGPAASTKLDAPPEGAGGSGTASVPVVNIWRSDAAVPGDRDAPAGDGDNANKRTLTAAMSDWNPFSTESATDASAKRAATERSMDDGGGESAGTHGV